MGLQRVRLDLATKQQEQQKLPNPLKINIVLNDDKTAMLYLISFVSRVIDNFLGNPSFAIIIGEYIVFVNVF